MILLYLLKILVSMQESQYLCFKTPIQTETSPGLRHLCASFGMKKQDEILGTP